jgi:hypothetical protein
MNKELLDYFKVMLVEKSSPKVLNYDFMTKGILLDFTPSKEQTIAKAVPSKTQWMKTQPAIL